MADEFKMVPDLATWEEITSAFHVLPSGIAGQVAGGGLFLASKVVLKRAKELVPVKSGRLRDALRAFRRSVKFKANGYQTAIIGGKAFISSQAERTNVYWAHFVEQGTRYQRTYKTAARRGKYSRRLHSREDFGPGGRTRAFRYIQRAQESTVELQRQAFIRGSARAFALLERRIKAEKLTAFQKREFIRGF